MGDHQLILSLGGNMGNKTEIFAETRSMIRQMIGLIQDESPTYETPPWGFESSDHFHNQVILISTGLTPHEVLQKIKEIESHFGRERKRGIYLPRKMDIDILFYDNMIIADEVLTVPHPLIPQRRFVLIPLSDLVPDLSHPVTGKTVTEMLEVCTDRSFIIKCS